MVEDFADSSGQGHVLTATGAVLSREQYKFNFASYKFDGDADYIDIPDDDMWDFGTAKFTIDLWIYLNSTSDTIIINHGGKGSATDVSGWSVGLASGNLVFQSFSGASANIVLSGAWNPSTGVWYHVTVVRDGDDFYSFIDGKTCATTNDSDAVVDSALTLRIGQAHDGGLSLNGYIDECRIYGNRAVWPFEFVPPESSAPGIDKYDVFVMPADGSNGSTSFKDVSRSVHSISVQGTVQISTAQYKFGNSSAYFNGSSYLWAANNSEFLFGTEEFTVSLWVYWPSSVPASGESLLGVWDGPINQRSWYFQFDGNTSVLYFYWSTTGANSFNANSSFSPASDTWYHLMAVRDNSANLIRLFVNGSQVGSSAIGASDSLYASSSKLGVGAAFSFGGGGSLFGPGYMDEVRITKGVARKTEWFVPPMEAHPKFYSPVVVGQETKLLLHMNEDNNSTTFRDYSPANHTISVTGNSKISTAQYKFLGSSGYFDGAGDYLSATDSELALGTEDFTVEMWIRPGSISGYRRLFGTNGGASTTSLLFRMYGATLQCYAKGSSPVASGSVLSVNTWHHVAVTWNSSASTLTLWADGINVASQSGLTNHDITETTVYFPSYYLGGEYFYGYMDEIRAVKGEVRYAGKFTPQTTYFPDVKDPDTALLLHFDENKYGDNTYVEDKSGSAHDVFFSGDAVISTSQSVFGGASLALDGTGDCLKLNDHADWTPAANFTLELRVRFGATTTQVLAAHYEDSSNYWSFYYDGTNLVFDVVDSGSTIVSIQKAWSPSLSTWYHLVVVREGSNWYFFVDGVSQSPSGTPDASAIPNFSGYLYIGGIDTSDNLNGYIDEFRFSHIDRWSASFPLPPNAYPDYV